MSKYVRVAWPESQKWMDQKYYDEGVEFSQSCGTTVFVPEELYNGFFEVTAVSRDDLKAAGFMADEVDDKIMERLASKMADAYVESSFWTDLEIIAEDLGIKREE